jgi:tetratricopeptide (TPR) repeat protein
VPLTPSERPLLERAWVGARIDRLTDQRSKLDPKDRDGRDGLFKQVVELSTRHRVLSDFTALLVLETEWDYQRFKIDRNALTDIMTVGVKGVELLDRRSAPPPPLLALPELAPPRMEEEKRELRDESGGSGQRHKGEEGKMGKPTSKSKSGLYAMKGPKDAIPQMARAYDGELAARQAGILGEMQEDRGHFLASPYGGAFAVGDDDADVWGGLAGTEVGEGYGVGGLGLVGTGRGGGGTGEGTIGLGNADTKKGSGTGSGYGRGAGAGFGGRGTRVPTVRQAKADVMGALDKDIIRRIVRAHINEVRYCYNQGLARDPNLKGTVQIVFGIDARGKVPTSEVFATDLPELRTGDCIAQAVRRWTFPKPEVGTVTVKYPFVLEPGGGSSDAARPLKLTAAQEQRLAELHARHTERMAEIERQNQIAAAEEAERERAREAEWAAEVARREAAEKLEEAEREAERIELERTEGSPYTGKMFDTMKLLAEGDTRDALVKAFEWHERSPGDVVALLALGEAAEAAGDATTAMRAYGSLIDLYPSRADLRRYAGARLERLGDAAMPLVVDTYARAAEQRPDHPASHRLYAYALARVGRHADAFAAIAKGVAQRYPDGRFAGVDRILGEDAAILAAAWLAAEPQHAAQIRQECEKLGVTPATAPSLRFVINWETDANDVDFHILDAHKERAYYGHKRLESGGELFADVTTGYGPECFAIPGKAAAFPYAFKAHYFSRGPMGYGMGKLQIVQHDGAGGLRFDDRPFIIMKDRADVELGTLERPL